MEVDLTAADLVGKFLVDLPVGEDLAAGVALEVEAAEAVVIDGISAVLIPAKARPKTAASGGGGVPIAHRAHSSKAERRAGARPADDVRPSARHDGFRRLFDGRGSPEEMPAAVWRRLRVLGSWPSAAGHPLGSLARAVSFDAAGVLTVSVPTERWARELGPHLEALRDRLGALAGERIAAIVVRVDPSGKGSVS